MPDEVFKSIAIREGSVEKIPVNSNDITNKNYVDKLIVTLIVGTLLVTSIVIGGLIKLSEVDGVLFINASTEIDDDLTVNGIIYGDAIGLGLDVLNSANIGNHLTVGDSLTVDTNTLYVDYINNRVGIGTITPSYKLDVVQDTSDATAWNLDMDGGPSGVTNMFGVLFDVERDTGTGNVWGFNGVAASNVASSQIFGMQMVAANRGSGNVGTLHGIRAHAELRGSGDVSSARAISVRDAIDAGSGSITNAYGLYIERQTKGIDDYGIYIQGADTKAIWVDAGDVRFDDALTVNEHGGDKDFRVEGLNNVNAFFVEGSSDNVGIGTATPSDKLEVIGNITADNVFLPQYISPHTNETIPVLGANEWTNITFNQEETGIKLGITHTYNDITNHTFTINADGIYYLSYNMDVIDTSASATVIDVAGRVIYVNGTEVIDSVFETDITRQEAETELAHEFLARLILGEQVVFQFIATDADVEMSTHGTFGDHPSSITAIIEKRYNLPT